MEDSVDHVFAEFERWEVHGLLEEEGDIVVEDEPDEAAASMAAARAAIRRMMADEQRRVLPDAAWAAVAAKLDKYARPGWWGTRGGRDEL